MSHFVHITYSSDAPYAEEEIEQLKSVISDFDEDIELNSFEVTSGEIGSIEHRDMLNDSINALLEDARITASFVIESSRFDPITVDMAESDCE